MSAQVNITPEVGQNLPVEHVKQFHKATPTQPGKALDQLKKILTDIDVELDASARVRVGAWVRNFMLTLYGGVRATWGYYNIQAGAWDTLDEKDMGRLYNVNVLLKDFTTLKATLERSRIKLQVKPSAAKASDVKAQMSAKVAQRKVDYDLRTEVDAEFLSREFTFMLLCGTYARYRGFDKSQGPMEQTALLEDKEVEQPGMFYCQNQQCGASGQADQTKDDMCPQCGGPTVQSDGNLLSTKVHTGYEENPAGRTCTYSVNPFELGMPNEATGPQNSAFLRWEQRARINFIADKYGIKPSVLKGSEALSPALTALQVIVNYGQSINLTDPNFGVFRRYWLEPFMYSEIESDEDIELVSGTQISKGKLSQYAPHGCYVAKMGDVFLDIQPASAADCWSGGQYHHHPTGPYGRGIDDGADIQEWMSEALSIKIEHALRDAVGMTFYKDSVGIDQSKMVGGANVKVTLPEPDAGLEKAILNVAPNASTGALDSTIEMGVNTMAGVLAAYDVMSGSNENVPDTATGISLLQEKAVGVQGQFLARWAASYCVWAKQGLRWAKKYQSEEQFIPFTSPGDKEAGMYFKGSNLETDYVIEAESDSWMPRTRLDGIADMERATQFVGALAPLVQDPSQLPDLGALISHFLTLINAPDGLDALEKDRQVAQSIVDKVKAGVAYYDAQPQPPTEEELPALMEKLMSMPSIMALPKMGSGAVFVKTAQTELKDMLDSDIPEDEPSPLMVLAMSKLVEIGQQAVIAEAQEKGKAMAAAAQPTLDAQKEAEGPPPEDTKADAEAVKAQTEQMKLQAAAELKDKEIQASQEEQRTALLGEHAQRDFEADMLTREQDFERAQSDRQMEFEKTQADANRKAEAARASADRKHQLQVAKSKPAPSKK